MSLVAAPTGFAAASTAAPNHPIPSTAASAVTSSSGDKSTAAMQALYYNKSNLTSTAAAASSSSAPAHYTPQQSDASSSAAALVLAPAITIPAPTIPMRAPVRVSDVVWSLRGRTHWPAVITSIQNDEANVSYLGPNPDSAKVPLSVVQPYAASGAAADKYRTQTNAPAFTEAIRAANVLIAGNAAAAPIAAAAAAAPLPQPQQTSTPAIGTVVSAPVIATAVAPKSEPAASGALFYAAAQPNAQSQYQAVHHVLSTTAASSAAAAANASSSSPAKPVQQQPNQAAANKSFNHLLGSPIKQNETLPTPGEMSPVLMSQSVRPASSAVRASPSQSGFGFRANPLTYSPSMSGVMAGTRIQLRSPDTIHHKLRDYAYTAATVIDIPMHPNTWFGVRLHDGTTVKIRKSAFDVLSGSQLHAEPPALSLAAAAAAGGSRTASAPGAGGAALFTPMKAPSAGAATSIPRAGQQTNAPLIVPPLPVPLPALNTGFGIHPPTSNAAAAAAASAAPSNSTIFGFMNPQQQQAQAAAAAAAFFTVPLPLLYPAGQPSQAQTNAPASNEAVTAQQLQQFQQQQQQLAQLQLQHQIAYNAAAAAHNAAAAVGAANAAAAAASAAGPRGGDDSDSLPDLDDEQRPSSPVYHVKPNAAAGAGAAAPRPKSSNSNPSGSANANKPKRPNSTNPQSSKPHKPTKNLVGRYVSVESGRYKGEIGFVTKGGNGYFTVQFIGDVPGFSNPINRYDRSRPGNFIMKRSGDLKHVNLGKAAPPRSMLYHNIEPNASNTVSESAAADRPIKRVRTGPSPSPASFDDSKSTASGRSSVVSEGGAVSPTPSDASELYANAAAAAAVAGSLPPLPGGAAPKPAVAGGAASTPAPAVVKKRKPTPTPSHIPGVHISSMSLTKQSAESWVDRRVLIKMGKYANQIGTILRSGHGFYCVMIPGRGEVQKRANELALVDEASSTDGGHHGSYRAAASASSSAASAAAAAAAAESGDDDYDPAPSRPRVVPATSAAAPAELSDAASILLHLMKDKSPAKKRRHSSLGGDVLSSKAAVKAENAAFLSTIDESDVESSDDDTAAANTSAAGSYDHDSAGVDVEASHYATAATSAAGFANSYGSYGTRTLTNSGYDRFERPRQHAQPFFFPSGTGESRFFIM